MRQRESARPVFFLLRDGAITFGDSLALIPWHVRVTSVPRITDGTSVLKHPRQREGLKSLEEDDLKDLY